MQFQVDSVVVSVLFYLILNSMTIVLAPECVYDREVVSAIAIVLNTPEIFLFP